MRRFMLIREVDETGISGTGHVADGVLFADGAVTIRWRTRHRSSGHYDSLDDAKSIHGHDGKTKFIFHDNEEKIVWLCCMCFADMDPPLNHCYQCGSGGSAVAMGAGSLDEIQRHDRQRLESIDKLHRELEALRRVAIDVYGPSSLGLSVARYTPSEGGPDQCSGIRCGNTITCVYPETGERDDVFLRRAGERCTLDPEHIRKVHAERSPRGSRSEEEVK